MHNMTIWLQQLSINRTRVRGACLCTSNNHDLCPSYSSSRNCHPKVAITFYVGGITCTLSIYKASRQLHSIYTFMLSIPAEGFYFSPTPQLYICRNENLFFKLQAKYFYIYIYPYIYTSITKLPDH